MKRPPWLTPPTIGIVAFSLCSVNAVTHLLRDEARHPTPALDLAAAIVELTTAWLVYQVVAQGRQLSRSRLSKQDRRFYGTVFFAFLLLAVPPLGLSIAANAREFDSWLLGVQFPLLSVACAIGAALPDTVAKFEQGKASERAEIARVRKERTAERKQQDEMRKTLARLGRAADTLALFAANPALTAANAGKELGVSRQTVSNHLQALENKGLIRRNGSGVEVLVEVKKGAGK